MLKNFFIDGRLTRRSSQKKQRGFDFGWSRISSVDTILHKIGHDATLLNGSIAWLAES